MKKKLKILSIKQKFKGDFVKSKIKFAIGNIKKKIQ